MVSHEAKNGFDKLMSRCLEETLKTAAHPAWILKPVSRLEDVAQDEFIMLTISSYAFRIFMLLHLTRDTARSNYVASALKLTPENLADTRFYDYVGEMGNTFVGAVKRELGTYFPHTGMSTPNRLVSDSLQFLSEMKFDHVSHVKAGSGTELAFYGSIFVSAYQDLDFRVENSKKSEESIETGALELF